MVTALIYVDEAWRKRTPDEFASDWLEPLTAHPHVDEVVLAGDGARLAAAHPKVRVASGNGDEISHIVNASGNGKANAVLRLRHTSVFRFPLTRRLVDLAIDGYHKNAPGGYYQLDLFDLPYNSMHVEVLGKAATQALAKGKIGLDWVGANLGKDGSYPVENANLPLDARVEYLSDPRVEYFTFPKFIALEASRLCNLRCTMCALHSEFIDHSHTDHHPKHFHLDKYQWILDQMEPYKDHLCIAPQFWGEPFMSPYLKDMILYARKKGIWLGFTTNGTLWDDEMIDFMIENGVYSLCVSMDGATKETYEQVRIGASFEKVVYNLNRLLERKKQLGSPTPYLQINMALFPENRHEQEKMIQDWLGKANMVSVSNHCVNSVVPEQHHRPERIPCPTLWEAIHINTNGDVIPCCRDSGYEEVMGNAYETPVLEIWNNAKYRWFRQKHMLAEWNDIPICERCDSWGCRSKRTLRKGDLMIDQYPYYQHFRPAPAGLTNTPVADAAAALVIAFKEAGQAVKRTLTNLTFRRKAG